MTNQPTDNNTPIMPPEFLPRDPNYSIGELPLVGIVGHGFVGKAVERSFQPEVSRFIVDPNYGTTIDQLVEKRPSLTFVCTPTPVDDNGAIDAAVTRDAILKLIRNSKSAVVLKSTVTPDEMDKICRTLHAEDALSRFVYAPEFLTEKNADQEFCEPNYSVFGGYETSVDELCSFYHHNTSVVFSKNVHLVGHVEAAYIKYAVNSFLAMKVIFFNQLRDYCEEQPWSTNPMVVAKSVAAEPRIGTTHWRAPGFDGKKGFGGACFPKDISAMVSSTKKFSLMEKVLEINSEYRKEYELDEREIAANIKFDDVLTPEEMNEMVQKASGEN